MSVKEGIEKLLKSKAEELQALADASHLADRLDAIMTEANEITKKLKALGVDLGSGQAKHPAKSIGKRGDFLEHVKDILKDGPMHHNEVYQIMKMAGATKIENDRSFGTMMSQLCRRGILIRHDRGVYGLAKQEEGVAA